MEGGRERKKKVEVSDGRREVEIKECEGTWRDGLKDGARKDQSEGMSKQMKKGRRKRRMM